MLDTKRSLGQYSTPIQTVDYMVERLLTFLQICRAQDQMHHVSILDPAAGDGIFVESLQRHGVHPTSILALDIDPTAVASLPPHINAECQDFLASEQSGFDAIIGNPPYKSKRESVYIQENRSRLDMQFKDVGIQNMYSMFVVHAIRSLREGGVLCVIVQDSFLTNVYYKNFRKYVVDNCLIHEITLAPRRLFHPKNADVRTAILILEKRTGEINAARRAAHVMHLVDRLPDEQSYHCPGINRVQRIEQKYFMQMDNHTFFINVPKCIIEIFQTTGTRLGDIVGGGTGISTGNDAKFLRKSNEPDRVGRNPGQPSTDASGDTFGAPNPDNGSDDAWVPFYKNGGAGDAWFYETPYLIGRDWKTASMNNKDFLARNAEYYFREGITCSSMGIEFSAAYLPPGCLFGVNGNFFAKSREDLFYILGFLNSLLVKYLIRAVLNRTNMVTAGYIKRLPYVEPEPPIKRRIANIAEEIVEVRRSKTAYDPVLLQQTIDQLIFDIYRIEARDQARIEQFCANMFESL